MSQTTIPLPRFLQLLAQNNVPMKDAMAVAGKIYKEYNTPAKLNELDEVKLVASGVSNKDTRKAVVKALRKAGYGPTKASNQPGPSTMTAVEVLTTPTKRKRKRTEDVNEFLPAPKDESADVGNLDFNEIQDEEVLMTKSTVVNRAPLMTAWATLVAERLGFQREEALSIASVFTELNAISKGVSLGIYKKGAEIGMEASTGGSQPYVDLMGRRVPLFRTQDSQWRALSNGTAVQPSTAFSYIARQLRQTTPHVIGALRLLSQSFTPQEINSRAWGLYADFRPHVTAWGERGEVKCSTILNLRPERRGVDAHPAERPVIETVQETQKTPTRRPRKRFGV
ncbi:hypothetical protein FB45DRAFT_415481 [Roridomyces roridus]|uniref:Uncharacterized protein n=1 Tax=Roridomyces roridus TaxID=1738132 RepID=A0AAD7C4T0_9AGAR|nr:hypothetical protein FB45DRAFT_415481 [Roridomyces roridus]